MDTAAGTAGLPVPGGGGCRQGPTGRCTRKAAGEARVVPVGQLPGAAVADFAGRFADRARPADGMRVLSQRRRSVVALRHWARLTAEEAAAALGVPAGTVRSTLHRALARLRGELECGGL